MHRYTMQFYIRNLSILGFQYLPGIQAPIPSRIPRDNYSTAHNPTLLQLWKLKRCCSEGRPCHSALGDESDPTETCPMGGAGNWRVPPSGIAVPGRGKGKNK